MAKIPWCEVDTPTQRQSLRTTNAVTFLLNQTVLPDWVPRLVLPIWVIGALTCFSNRWVQFLSAVTFVLRLYRACPEMPSRQSGNNSPCSPRTHSQCDPDDVDAACQPLQTQLEGLRLKVSPAMQQEVSFVLEQLTDIISTRINNVVSDGIDSEEEAKMWSCFAQVYQREVEAYYERKGKPPSMNRKRQLFADILVWAEVTRPGYDAQAASFITGVHNTDEAFQRIGKELAAAKLARGVTKL